jgi:hypothetical protein
MAEDKCGVGLLGRDGCQQDGGDQQGWQAHGVTSARILRRLVHSSTVARFLHGMVSAERPIVGW